MFLVFPRSYVCHLFQVWHQILSHQVTFLNICVLDVESCIPDRYVNNNFGICSSQSLWQERVVFHTTSMLSILKSYLARRSIQYAHWPLSVESVVSHLFVIIFYTLYFLLKKRYISIIWPQASTLGLCTIKLTWHITNLSVPRLELSGRFCILSSPKKAWSETKTGGAYRRLGNRISLIDKVFAHYACNKVQIWDLWWTHLTCILYWEFLIRTTNFNVVFLTFDFYCKLLAASSSCPWFRTTGSTK